MKRILFFFFLCIQFISIDAAFANDYPKRPIKLMISYEQGFSEDILARFLANKLSSALGQEIKVVNHNTMSSDVAMNMLLANKPDGYTIAITDLNPFGPNAFLGDAIHYEMKEVSALNILASSPMAVVVKANSSWNTFANVVNAAKTGRRLRVAVTDNASRQMLQWIGVRTGAKFSYVEQDDLANILRMLDENHADIAVLGNVALDSAKLAGKVKPVASSGLAPFRDLPSVSTFKAQGVDFIYDSYTMLSVPSATPDDVKNRIQSEVNNIVNSSEYQNLLIELKLNKPIVYNADGKQVAEHEAIAYLLDFTYKRAITIVNRVGRKPKR